MTKEEKLAEEYIDKEYSELKYEKCERKDFIFTFYELKEMGKQAFLVGYKVGQKNAETDLATVAYMQGAERYKSKWHKVAGTKMIEVDLNNGVYRKVDLNKPCFCSKCGKEIIRGKNCNTVDLIIDVHACGYVFCKKCKKELNDYAGNKVAEYEKKLVERFVNGEKIEERVKNWVDDMGGEDSALYQTFPDEEITELFLKAIKYA